jgi:serine/threonine-protein kinase
MAADHDLLFGLLSLQNGLIDQVQLVAAFQAWTRDRASTLADHLMARGDIDSEQRALLDALVAQHLKKHGGDAEKSLAAISVGRSTRESLARLGDADIEGTLARAGSGATQQDRDSDPDRTATYSVGSATSDGLRFRVLRPHARGGLGAVFVALDTELHREVALKQILDHHADDPASRHRFLIEAEITGGLEHPGIVPVYGLGTYGDGRPYYAMRFIRGDSLKEAIAHFHADGSLKTDPGRRSLALRKLLRRFTDVCNAIEYAHSRGVLHRDLKPGNIIVGKHGETLVVDWGLAKALGRSEPGAEERTLLPSSASGSAETLPGSALGTPAYMSPEQARGDLNSLGPRSDVYSLGATLYCLLTGKPPQEGDDVGEVLRKVQRGEFTAPRLLDPSIDEALEAVCLKAMSMKPEDRYASCRGLAEDIERWMADEPVTGWREPWTRTLLRWLTRHRTGVIGGAAAGMVALVGLGAVTLVQTRANAELATSKAAVQARYDLAVEAIKTFHTGASEDFLLKQDQFKELRDRLLLSASGFYGKLSALLGRETDPVSRRALAASNFELADLTGKVGGKEDALKAHRAVLAAREALAAEAGADAAATVDVGRSLTEIARLLEATGRTDEALATYRRSESLLTGVATAQPAAREALASCRSMLGRLLYTMDKYDDALAAFKLARADQEALAAAPGASNEARNDLSYTIQWTAAVLERTGKLSEVEAANREVLAIRQKLADDNPAVIGFLSGLALSHNNLANALWSMGKPSEAEAEYRRAIAIFQKLVDENPAVIKVRFYLAISHVNLGQLLTETGKLSEAEAEIREGMVLYPKLVDSNPAVTDFRSQLANSHFSLGVLLSKTGKLSEAEAEIREAIALYQKLVDSNPAVTDFRSKLASYHNSLGLLLLQTGQPAEAESELRRALDIFRKLADDNPKVPVYRKAEADVDDNLSDVLRRLGRPADARALCERAVAAREVLVREDPNDPMFRSHLAWSYRRRGLALGDLGDVAGAAADARRAIALWEGLPSRTGYEWFETACAHVALAGLAGRAGSGVSAAEAVTEADAAMALLPKAIAMGYPSLYSFRTPDALDPLRGRDDFRLMMMDLAMPAGPFAPPR